MQNIDFWTRITSFYASQTSLVLVCMQNSDFWTRIKNLYWSQTSPVVLCMQHRVISAWITSLYGSQHSSVVFACKTTTFEPELQVSKGPRPHLSFCARKTAWLVPEILVSIGSSPHLWNNKSLLVPALTCGFVHAKTVISTWVTSLYGSQHSSEDFAYKTTTFGQKLLVSIGPRPHLSFCACKTATFGPE